MQRLVFIIVFSTIGSLSLLTAGSQPEEPPDTPVFLIREPQLWAEDYGTPGTLVPVVLAGEDLEDAGVSLVNDQGKSVSRVPAFSWSHEEKKVLVALLGIPSSAAPGSYRLSASARREDQDILLEKFFEVQEKEFASEVITLNKSMGGLYKDTSSQKKEEARHLWVVLESFHPESSYHGESLLLPLEEYTSTAGYGDKRRYRFPDGTENPSIHKGQDLWAPTGTPIFAAGGGKVVLARERMVTGNSVILEHLPGVHTLYYHLDSLAVGEGEVVKSGQLLGTLGATGLVTGEHLHWELRSHGVPVDAFEYLETPLLDTTRILNIIRDNLLEGG